MTDLAHYYFIPALREGLAAYLDTPATAERAQVRAVLTPSANGNAQDVIEKLLWLYGPGDVVGFDESVVTRTDPRQDTWDYEPNYLPLCEFSESDLPWRFTPDVFATHSGSSYVMPWLSLIVLAEGEFDGFGERLREEDDEHKTGLPIRWVEGAHVDKLPDLAYAWMWAHVHVTSEDGKNKDALRDIVSGDDVTKHVVSRLVCPRRLASNTKYSALVVPTFKIAQVAAGLITPPATPQRALDPAWTSADSKVNLPYYYRWDFACGIEGDFESLVKALQPRALEHLGQRPIDCAAVGYRLPPCIGEVDGPHVLQLEGALMSPDLSPGQWTADNMPPEVSTFRQALADRVNLPANLVARVGDGAIDVTPVVVPPVYGRWHSGQSTVSSAATTPWRDDVNLDVRQRAAAGLGALVVQKEQESLMAAVWDQLGQIELANQTMRNGLLGLKASTGVFGRMGALSLPAFLWVASPVFPRIRVTSPATAAPMSLAHVLDASPIPTAAFDPAFRRVLRRRGGIRKQQTVAPPPSPGWDLLSRFNNRDVSAAGAWPKPPGMPSICDVTDAAISAVYRHRESARAARGAYLVLGKVVYAQSGHAVDRVRVEVWDKDLFFSDLVGSAITDNAGAFSIEFDQSYFREWFLDRKPDLMFKVFRGEQRIRVLRPGVMKDVHAGTTRVQVEIENEAGGAPPPQSAQGRIYDFCEAGITKEDILKATASQTEWPQLHRDAAASIATALDEWLTVPPVQDAAVAVDLRAIRTAVLAAINPDVTIPARLAKRQHLGSGTHQRAPLERIESDVEFPQPMYEPLAAISQDLILPGVQTVPPNTVSILQTNRRFLESYMLGLNDALSGEVLWRGAPVYLWTTYFRQFWDVRGLLNPDAAPPEESKDIRRLAAWAAASQLGSHDPRPSSGGERAVVLVRGDLLKRYRDTLLYLVPSQVDGRPALDEYGCHGDADHVWPILSGTLPPDLSFFGFNLTPSDLCAGAGYFLVLEQRLGQPRFGFDILPDGQPLPALDTTGPWWYDLTWAHLAGVGEGDYINGRTPSSTGLLTPRWADSSATIANISLQRPVRVAIHARQMLPASVCAGTS
jgi:hypothetical protein